MRNLAAAALVFGVGLIASAQADTVIRVEFVDAGHYTDAGVFDSNMSGREPVLQALQTYLEQQGARYLKPGQAMKIDILDIDLAGRFEPWHSANYDVRYMRDVTWPVIKLHYSLAESGHILRQGEETISDPNYLTSTNVISRNDTLSYEKAMLSDWFRARFGKPDGAS